MHWDFSAEDVVKARSSYGLVDFRRDLAAEVRSNLIHDTPARQRQFFDLLYDLCHALATARSADALIAAHAHDPPTCQLLRELEPMMDENAVMLGAILQRMIMDGVEAGQPLDSAVQETARRHAAIVGAGAGSTADP